MIKSKSEKNLKQINFPYKNDLKNIKTTISNKNTNTDSAGFMFFKEERKSQILSENTELKGKELLNKLTSLWKKLSKEEQEKYAELEKAKKMNFKKEGRVNSRVKNVIKPPQTADEKSKKYFSKTIENKSTIHNNKSVNVKKGGKSVDKKI